MQDNENKVDLIIYRVKDKGLEVFLMENGETAQSTMEALIEQDLIELEPYTDENGALRQAVAVEADWHDIPSLRSLVKEDYLVAKEKAKAKIKGIIHEIEPSLDLDNGTYFAVKDAVKKVLPAQYSFLKELKDIVCEKNSVKYV